MNGSEKIRLLIWKNVITQRTIWMHVLGQFLLCLFASIILIEFHLNNTSNERRFTDEPIIYQKVGINDLSALRNSKILEEVAIKKMALTYAPKNEIVKKLIEGTTKKLGIEAIPVDRDGIAKFTYMEKVFAAVVFPPEYDNITKLPRQFSYALRFPGKFRTSNSSQLLESVWITRDLDVTTAQLERTADDLDVYVTEGFVTVENVLFETYVELALQEPAFKDAIRNPLDNNVLPKIHLRNFPFLPKAESLELGINSDWIEFIFFVSFLWPVMNLVWIVSREHQDLVKVFLKVYNIKYWMHWLAHFVIFFVQFQTITITLIVLGKIQWTSDPASTFFGNSNSIMVWLFLTLYNISLILFGFIVATLVPRARPAVTFTLLIILLLRGIFSLILEHTDHLSSASIAVCFLYFNNVLSFGIRYIYTVEQSDQNFDSSHLNPETGSAGYLFLMVLLQIPLYLAVLYYIQELKPGTYIKGKSWNFPCAKAATGHKPGDEIPPKGVNPDFVEYGPLYFPCAVKLTQLRKVKNYKSIVQNLSLKMYENEITVILGHKGSGKTTTMSLIAGMRNPTYGNVKIYNDDVSTDEAKSNLGICPRNNCLFQHLTISEHLNFHLKLKNCQLRDVATEITKCFRLMEKSEKGDDKIISKLSYNEQRVLCLLLALCGRSKVILCDEPTLHMYAADKRMFWNILQEQKKGKCIVVATHCFNEADAIGDRIAILSDGALSCYGTSYFLKKKLGGGYNLFLVKRDQAPTENITKFLKKYVPKIIPENEIGDQVHYKISEDYSGVFSKMLSELEAKKDELKIVNFGILSGRLEEVYMNVGMKKNIQLIYDKEMSVLAKHKPYTGWTLIKRQIVAMAYKRMIHQAPNILPLLVSVLSFLLMILLGSMAASSISSIYRYESISMDLDNLKGTIIILEIDRRITDVNSFKYKLHQTFESQLKNLLDDDYDLIETYEPFEHYIIHQKSEVFQGVTRAIGQQSFALWTTGRQYVGITIAADGILAWYNGRHFHTASLSLNFLHNIILKTVFDNSFSVAIHNKPLNMSIESKFEFLEYDLAHMELPLTVGTIIPFMVSVVIIFLINERRSHVRCLQFIAGIKIPIYYIIGFLWDWFNYFVFSAIFTTAILLINIEGITFFDKMRILLVLNIFGFSAIASIYLLSRWFDDPLTGFFGSSALSLATGLFAYVLYTNLLNFNMTFHWIAMISPHFSLLDAIGQIFKRRQEAEFCSEERALHDYSTEQLCERVMECCDTTVFKWEFPGIYPNITYMAITGFLCIIAYFVLEYIEKMRRFNSETVENIFPMVAVDSNTEVIREKARICRLLQGKVSDYTIIVDQLETDYRNKGKYSTISFALQRSECLGILGARKSGKSSVCRKLSGREGYSYGDVLIGEHAFKIYPDRASRWIGYSPQDHGVLDEFSGREMLRLLCIIRGVPERDINPLIRELGDAFGLRRNIAKKVSRYSFGEKRKLNIACALVAGVSVLIIDEPTSGIDALSRRQIWNVLRYVRYCGKSVIFTSSSSYECEILGDHVLIFVEGGMKSVGSIENTMAKFCSGFILEVKLMKDGTNEDEVRENLKIDVQNMITFAKFLSENSEVRFQSDNVLKFYIPVVNLDWVKIFTLMEKHKKRLNILDYLVSRMTLDEILSTFAELNRV